MIIWAWHKKHISMFLDLGLIIVITCTLPRPVRPWFPWCKHPVTKPSWPCKHKSHKSLTSILSLTQVLARKSSAPGPLSPPSMLTVSASSVRLGLYSLRVRQWVWPGEGQTVAGGGAGPQLPSSLLVHWEQSRPQPGHNMDVWYLYTGWFPIDRISKQKYWNNEKKIENMLKIWYTRTAKWLSPFLLLVLTLPLCLEWHLNV